MEFLGVSLAAWMSILALTIVIIISCINEELHVGNLSIAFGIVVGAVFMNMSGSKIVMGFPLSLFMILVGVTFMFAMAQVNGTLGKVTSYAIRSCGGNMMLLPFIIYILTIFITTIGPGNIAGVALLAPITFGEGYHNYHHMWQWDYRNGPRWYNFDPSKWLIFTLSKLRLAYNLQRHQA